MTTRGAGRPTAGGYRLEDGTRVPSVTTITGRFKDSGGLIRWAYNCGRDGIDIDRAKEAAGDAGSIAHGWIEEHLHGNETAALHEGEGDETTRLAWGGYSAFLDWERMVSLEVIETETPLISERFRFGGTLDCVGLVSGEKALIDWKSSNSVYREYISQVAAYRQLLRERDGEVDAPDRAFLLRVGKTHADFAFYSWPSAVLDLGWRWFLLARELYDADAVLKKVA